MSNESKKRTYIIGDSFTAGFKYAAEGKDFPSLIEQKNKNMKVINMGIGGKSIPHYIEWITELDLRKSDKIVLVLYENDILIDKESCDLINFQNKKYKTYKPSICNQILSGELKPINEDNIFKNINNYLRSIYLVKLLKNALYQFDAMKFLFTRELYQNLWSELNNEENLYIQQSILFINDYVKSRDVSIYYTYFPNTNDIYKSKDKHRDTWATFLNHMLQFGIIINDPFEFFSENAEESKMTHSITDYHPNHKANLLMAKYVSQLLE